MTDVTNDNPLLAEAESKKKGSPVVMIAAVAGLSLAAVGVGYMVGGMVRSQSQAPAGAPTTADAGGGHGVKADAGHGEAAPAHGADAGGHGDGAHAAGGETIMMTPIIVTLPKSNNSWLRLELAMVVEDGKPGPSEAESAKILAQISGYLRTTNMDQIYGPSGYLHLHDDVLDIARRATDGAIADVMVLSLVAE